jgi:hypothetical protein
VGHLVHEFLEGPVRLGFFHQIAEPPVQLEHLGAGARFLHASLLVPLPKEGTQPLALAFEDRRLPALGLVPKRLPDLLGELIVGERLADVPGHHVLQPEDVGADLGRGREHHYLHALGQPFLLQGAQDRPAIHVRHVYVQEHQVRPLRLDLGQAFPAADGRERLIARIGDQFGDDLQDGGIIVHDQDLFDSNSPSA